VRARETCVPPVKAMFARNGILAGGDRTTGIADGDTECPAETGRRRNRQRKCRHKRPIRTLRENTRFEGTGWWRQDGSKLSAHHPVIERVSKLSEEREFSMQRLSGETGLFAESLPAETAQMRELGPHVFDISAVVRVFYLSHNLYEWLVGTTGIEPVTPTMSR
jgi:hypothetical protein